MSNIDTHHVIPVSIYGHDTAENIISIDRRDHKAIHKVLYLCHKKLRKFRLETNHIVDHSSIEFVDRLRSIHVHYFANYEDLTKESKNRIKHSIMLQCEAIRRWNGIYYRLPSKRSHFNEWLRVYHELLKLKTK